MFNAIKWSTLPISNPCQWPILWTCYAVYVHVLSVTVRLFIYHMFQLGNHIFYLVYLYRDKIIATSYKCLVISYVILWYVWHSQQICCSISRLKRQCAIASNLQDYKFVNLCNAACLYLLYSTSLLCTSKPWNAVVQPSDCIQLLFTAYI